MDLRSRVARPLRVRLARDGYVEKERERSGECCGCWCWDLDDAARALLVSILRGFAETIGGRAFGRQSSGLTLFDVLWMIQTTQI